MMLIDLKSRAPHRITVQLPASMACPRFPMQKVTVQRRRTVKAQSEPVMVPQVQALPPVLSIGPGEVIVGLPLAVLDLDAIKHFCASRSLVASKPYKEAVAVPEEIPAPQDITVPIDVAAAAVEVEAELSDTRSGSKKRR